MIQCPVRGTIINVRIQAQLNFKIMIFKNDNTLSSDAPKEQP